MFVSKTSSIDLWRSELDYYLEESLLLSISDFDILVWVARDILAVHVSTVAFESAFNTSDRFFELHYSRLLPKTLEALMCAWNWLLANMKGMKIICIYVFNDL